MKLIFPIDHIKKRNLTANLKKLYIRRNNIKSYTKIKSKIILIRGINIF